MTRLLYRCLVGLHPRRFRRKFSAEMIWIFDEVSAAHGVTRLFADGIVSLARQWLIQQGIWKVLAATVGGLLYIVFALIMASPSWG